MDDTTGESSGESQRMNDDGGIEDKRTNGNRTVTYKHNTHVHTHTRTHAHSHTPYSHIHAHTMYTTHTSRYRLQRRVEKILQRLGKMPINAVYAFCRYVVSRGYRYRTRMDTVLL